MTKGESGCACLNSGVGIKGECSSAGECMHWIAPAPASQPPAQPERRAADVERAFQIADEAMFELLNSECIPQDEFRTTLGLVSESYTEVRLLADASDAIRDAVEWLEPRGFVKVSKDEAGEYIDVLRRPGDDN